MVRSPATSPSRCRSVQRGNRPDVTVSDAIKAAEERVSDGEVTDAELARENQRTVWDVSVEVAGGDDWSCGSTRPPAR